MSGGPAGRSVMTRWLSVAALGAATAVGGILHGVLTVGVPRPEPTPAQAAAERTNLAVSSWTTALGGIMLVGGLVAAAIDMAGRARKVR